MLRTAIILGAALLPLAASAQTSPNQHGPFDTNPGSDAGMQSGAPYVRQVPTSPYSWQSTASANDQVPSAAPVQVFSVVGCNQSAALRYVRLFNQATPPNGSTTPVQRYSLAPNSGCVTLFIGNAPLAFSVGLAFDITTTNADADQTATGAGDVSLNLSFR